MKSQRGQSMNQFKKITIEGIFEVPQDMYVNILCPILCAMCEENDIKFKGKIESTIDGSVVSINV